MGVPAGLAAHLESLHGLVAVECVFYRARQNMVDARMAVGRRRPLEEDELRAALALVHRFMEHVVLIPFLQYLLVNLRKVQAIMFGEFVCHDLFFRY